MTKFKLTPIGGPNKRVELLIAKLGPTFTTQAYFVDDRECPGPILVGTRHDLDPAEALTAVDPTWREYVALDTLDDED